MEIKQNLYQKVRSVDIVDYLSSLGHFSVKIKGPDYWFKSPFRDEKEASFKVNRDRNIWYDHGIGKGGNLLEFGKMYFNCSFEEVLEKFNQLPDNNFSFHNQISQNGVQNELDSTIQVKSSSTIADPDLISYLKSRCIPLEIANEFCSEVKFQLFGKEYTSIGFRNDLGGFELRSENFKGSSSPKSSTLIKNESNQISVFEGFFDFLSFQTMKFWGGYQKDDLPKKQSKFLILNSLAFLFSLEGLFKNSMVIHLYLDRDKA